MKFDDVSRNEAFKFINEKQYNTIINGTAKHCTKFNLWMGIVESKGISPFEMTLPEFYK